jgi:hypothetical protein
MKQIEADKLIKLFNSGMTPAEREWYKYIPSDDHHSHPTLALFVKHMIAQFANGDFTDGRLIRMYSEKIRELGVQLHVTDLATKLAVLTMLEAYRESTADQDHKDRKVAHIAHEYPELADQINAWWSALKPSPRFKDPSLTLTAMVTASKVAKNLDMPMEDANG